ncbi:MAG: hypothetical protein ACXAEU_16150 [Candidatus Hodarchaeales archaeon]|jgi:hypothetical protein
MQALEKIPEIETVKQAIELDESLEYIELKEFLIVFDNRLIVFNGQVVRHFYVMFMEIILFLFMHYKISSIFLQFS